MKNESSRDLITGALVVGALLTTGVLGFRDFQRREAPSTAPLQVVKLVADWQALASTGIGSEPLAGESIVVVEFADVQCEFCAIAAARLDSLMAARPGAIRLVHKHYPMERHPHAFAGAMALECAHEQRRFSPMRSAVFAKQRDIGSGAWRGFARDAGVSDLVGFDNCMSAEATANRVRSDKAAGDAIAVQATPTFVVNGRVYVGAAAVDSVAAMIAAQ